VQVRDIRACAVLTLRLLLHHNVNPITFSCRIDTGTAQSSRCTTTARAKVRAAAWELCATWELVTKARRPGAGANIQVGTCMLCKGTQIMTRSRFSLLTQSVALMQAHIRSAIGRGMLSGRTTVYRLLWCHRMAVGFAGENTVACGRVSQSAYRARFGQPKQEQGSQYTHVHVMRLFACVRTR
jgi:hypothetical protein